MHPLFESVLIDLKLRYVSLLFVFVTVIMPITRSAKKALKVSNKKHSRNQHFRALLKESIKSFEILLKAEKKDTKKLNEALSSVYSRIDTLEKKNIIEKRNAARKKSSFAKMLKTITA